jgi:hypothetical protein
LCRVAGKYKTYLKTNDFYLLLKGQSHEIFCIRFFTNQIFSKIRGDICKSRCTTGINDTGGKFASGTAGVVDTCGKFAAGVNDAGGAP